MSPIIIVCNSRAERGPLESVIAALPEARVVGCDVIDVAPHSAMSNALSQFTVDFAGAKLVILLGDRYETLAAALAATFARVPIAHIHGGETTAGAFDDAFRHSITHMAALHFVATEKAGKRISAFFNTVDFGYAWNWLTNVHLVGAPGLDGVPENSRDRSYDYKKIIACFMPETRRPDYGLSLCRDMLTALEPYAGPYDIMFTGVNADPGAAEINELTVNWVATHPDTKIRSNIPHDKYIWFLQHSALCIGNSSSFVIESPWVGLPTVLVGDRQLGREMANTVFQNDYDIGAAITAALAFNETPKPIYRGGAAEKIAAVCRSFVNA